MINLLEQKLIAALKGFNYFLHVLLAIALVVASLMLMWEFSAAVYRSVNSNNIAHGFFQALGTLFIVWTLSSLIAAEINYVQTGVFKLTVFIEVAVITLLRQLIVEPVQLVSAGGSPGTIPGSMIVQHVLVLAALLVVGVLHWLVSSSHRNDPATTPAGLAPTPPPKG